MAQVYTGWVGGLGKGYMAWNTGKEEFTALWKEIAASEPEVGGNDWPMEDGGWVYGAQTRYTYIPTGIYIEEYRVMCVEKM